MSATPASPPVRAEGWAATPGMPASLRQVTGFLLRRAHVRSVAELDRAMAAHERPRDLGILLLLAARGPLSQHELSCEWGINRTAMVKLVDRLEGAGYVLRERNPVDRRSYALQLTDEGRAATKRLLGSVLAAEDRLTATLDAGQRDRLRELLAALVDSPVPEGAEEVTARTPFLVTRAHRAVREVGERLLAPHGIEPRHAGALTTIAGLQPCSQQQLADAIGISAPTALEVVGDLLERGLVTRERDPSDRRAYVVELTAAGSERLGQARQAFAGSRRHLIERLGVAGEEELRELLTVMLTGDEGVRGGWPG